MSTTRREFLVGCSTAIAALAGARLTSAGFSRRDGSGGQGVLIVLSLRGGIDGLHLLAPANDPDYIAARPASLRVTDSGEFAGIPVSEGPAGLDFRLHAKAAPLAELYKSGQLAFVHACGLKNGTRSHFEAMDLMERGVSETRQKSLASGWLARYVADNSMEGVLPVAAIGGRPPDSLLGSPAAVAMNNIDGLTLYADAEQRAALRKLYGDASRVGIAGRRTLDALEEVGRRLERKEDGSLVPYEPSAGSVYPENELGQALQPLARLIKMDVGLQVATLEFGGWDMHQNQIWSFPYLLEQLSLGLASFMNDISAYSNRVTLVVLSEFGRRLKSNQSNGTDHGHGNVMMVLGGGVKGGRIYGSWPGLATEQLDSHADLAVTTDYRQVLTEILSQRFGAHQVDKVFPGFEGGQRIGLFA